MQKTGRYRKHSRKRHPTRRAITGPTGVRLAENAQRLHPFSEVRGPSTNFSGAERQQKALQTPRAASTFGRIPRGHDRKFDLTLDAALSGSTTTSKRARITSTKSASSRGRGGGRNGVFCTWGPIREGSLSGYLSFLKIFPTCIYLRKFV